MARVTGVGFTHTRRIEIDICHESATHTQPNHSSVACYAQGAGALSCLERSAADGCKLALEVAQIHVSKHGVQFLHRTVHIFMDSSNFGTRMFE